MNQRPDTDTVQPAKTPSPWEWLPPVALAALAVAYCLAPAGSGLGRFSLFVGLGLVPGTVWRLCGRPSWNVHRIGFALGLVAFVIFNPALRPDAAMWDRIVRNWRLVLLGILISFTQPVWGMLRTHRLLADSGASLSFYDTFKLILSGSFFNIFLPGSTGGDAYRVYAISDGYRQRLGPAIASITIDRLLGLPSLILVVLLGMALDYDFFLGNKTLSSIVPFLAGAGVVCLAFVVYLSFASKSGRRTVDGDDSEEVKPAGRLARLHRMVSANVHRPATLPLALFYGFASHIAVVVSCQVFAVALGAVGVPALRYYLIVPMAMTINAIPGAPGGVGQGELAMATFLDLASPGVGNAQIGVMVMLLFRLSNLAIGLAGGVYYAMGKIDFRDAIRGVPGEGAD